MSVGNKTFRSLEQNLKQVTTKFHGSCKEKKVVRGLSVVTASENKCGFCRTCRV